jgi:dephospho-CoA kinase
MAEGRQRPPFIGLTGAVASGKSTALAELEKLGAATLSTDQVVHDLYADPELIKLVAGRLGDDVIVDGAVDREAVAAKVFNEPEARVWLEQVIWPRVGQAMFSWKQSHEAADPPPRALVVEVPLLFESGMDQAFDDTLAITVSDELRRERAAARGAGVSELEARDARHLGQADKAARAGHVVVNDGSVEQLAQRLADILTAIERAPRS